MQYECGAIEELSQVDGTREVLGDTHDLSLKPDAHEVPESDVDTEHSFEGGVGRHLGVGIEAGNHAVRLDVGLGVDRSAETVRRDQTQADEDRVPVVYGLVFMFVETLAGDAFGPDAKTTPAKGSVDHRIDVAGRVVLDLELGGRTDPVLVAGTQIHVANADRRARDETLRVEAELFDWLVVAVGYVLEYGALERTDDELGTGCAFCSYAGDYAIGMTGLYIDASVDLDI